MPDVDHYAVLGLAPDADHETIRAAWIRAARQSHPDRLDDPDRAAREAADARIREVNEAWRVLGDAELRAKFDDQRHRAARRDTAPMVVSEDGPVVNIDIEPNEGFQVRSEGVAALLRSLPWLIVGSLGVGIFVFTAFAGSGRSEPAGTTSTTPECVRIRADGTVRPVPCRWDNDGVIDQFIPLDSDAPCRHDDARPHDAGIHNARLCLVPYEDFVE